MQIKLVTVIGLNFGLRRFLTSSDGQDIESPDFFKQKEKYIMTKSLKLSRKQKASNNQE